MIPLAGPEIKGAVKIRRIAIGRIAVLPKIRSVKSPFLPKIHSVKSTIL